MNKIDKLTNNDVLAATLPKHFKICICLPTMGSLHMSLVGMLLKWQREFPPGSIHYYFTYRVSGIERARNQCVEYVLNNKVHYTHMLFIDADTIPPALGLLKLLHADKDIVTGMTPMLQYDPEIKSFASMYNCFTRKYREDGTLERTEAPEENTGLIKIDRCGSSFIMIKREVLEKLEKPLYKFDFNDDYTQHDRSEDLRFCDNAREAGFDVWCDTSVVCNHYKEIML